MEKPRRVWGPGLHFSRPPMRLWGKGRISRTSVGMRCSEGKCNWLATVPLAHQQDKRGRRAGAERTPVDATASTCQPVEWPARWLKIDTTYHHAMMRAVLSLQY